MMRFLGLSFRAGLYALLIIGFINLYMLHYSKSFIFKEVEDCKSAYTVVVLGARVYPDGTLSNYLQDRVDAALVLYKENKVKRFLLSGDHGTIEYDEVNAMKDYLTNEGVSESDIFLDHAGFNTYNSMVRAQKIFEVKDCIIVTQDYHLTRAVFIARKIGLEAYGLSCSSDHLGSNEFNKKREVLARTKSFLELMFAVEPKFLGEKISITSDSYLSYDR